jgi:hypothetical protein
MIIPTIYDTLSNTELQVMLEATAKRGGSIRPIIAACEKRGLKLRVKTRNAATGFDDEHRHLSVDDEDENPAA